MLLIAESRSLRATGLPSRRPLLLAEITWISDSRAFWPKAGPIRSNNVTSFIQTSRIFPHAHRAQRPKGMLLPNLTHYITDRPQRWPNHYRLPAADDGCPA